MEICFSREFPDWASGKRPLFRHCFASVGSTHSGDLVVDGGVDGGQWKRGSVLSLLVTVNLLYLITVL